MRTFRLVSCVAFLLLGISGPSRGYGAVTLGAGEGRAGEEATYLPVVDIMPEPIGGLAAIAKHLVYPDIARRGGVEGKVYLVAYINEKGEVDDVKVLKGLPGGCEEAAVKAVKETKFTAGKQNGAPVKSQLSIPISFRLSR